MSVVPNNRSTLDVAGAEQKLPIRRCSENLQGAAWVRGATQAEVERAKAFVEPRATLVAL